MIILNDFQNKNVLSNRKTDRYLTSNFFDTSKLKVIKTNNGIFLGIDTMWKRENENYTRFETLQIRVDNYGTACTFVPLRKTSFDFSDDRVTNIEKHTRNPEINGVKYHIASGYPVCVLYEKNSEIDSTKSVFQFQSLNSSLISKINKNSICLTGKGLGVLARFVETHQQEVDKQLNAIKTINTPISDEEFATLIEFFGPNIDTLFNLTKTNPIKLDIEKEFYKQNCTNAKYYG